MADQIRNNVTNNVVLAGKVAELEVRMGETKKKVPYISIKGAIQFGEQKVFTRRFEVFQQAYKVLESGSKKDYVNFDKDVDFVLGCISDTMKAKYSRNETVEGAVLLNAILKSEGKNMKFLTVADAGYADAVTTSISGNLKPNDYVSKDGKVKESLTIEAKFFNELKGDEYKGAVDVEGVVQKVIHEMKNGEETGRVRLQLVTFDFFGNAIPVEGIVDVDYADALEENYERGMTATFYFDYKAQVEEAKKPSGGLGVQRVSEGKSFLEMVLVGASSPCEYDEDVKNGALDPEAVKKALAQREATLSELEQKGYQGNANSQPVQRNGLGNSKPASTPSADEEIDF